jgi:hypothetical protein
MAMLLLPEVFQRTWHIEAPPFWPRAISCARRQAPEFVFMAEVYWDLEWALQQQGFDYCYDKRLYDRLRDGDARIVHDHLLADFDYQKRLARFLENHDEPRAAATFESGRHRAAAIVTYFSPGLRFFHQGQCEGRRKHISPHLIRAPFESANEALQEFYARLLDTLKHPAVRDGNWQLLECRPAWQGNWTHHCFIAFAWEHPAEQLIIAVNFSDHPSQAKLSLPFKTSVNKTYRFEDLINNATYDWPGSNLAAEGLFVDLPAWGSHVFAVSECVVDKVEEAPAGVNFGAGRLHRS